MKWFLPYTMRSLTSLIAMWTCLPLVSILLAMEELSPTPLSPTPPSLVLWWARALSFLISPPALAPPLLLFSPPMALLTPFVFQQTPAKPLGLAPAVALSPGLPPLGAFPLPPRSVFSMVFFRQLLPLSPAVSLLTKAPPPPPPPLTSSRPPLLPLIFSSARPMEAISLPPVSAPSAPCLPTVLPLSRISPS